MDDEKGYPAGTDVPGTPGPFPFDLLAGASGFAALTCAIVALFAEPIAVYGYWLLSLDWLVLGVIGMSRDKPKGLWIGAIGVVAPLAVSAMLGSAALIRIPG